MTKVCRLCLSRLQRGSKYFNINAVESFTGFMPYRDQLTTCIPEMALDLIPNPVICNNCRNSLKSSCDFKSRCLLVEKKIRQYVESQPCETATFNLAEIDTSSLPKSVKFEETVHKETTRTLPILPKQEVVKAEPNSSILSNLLTVSREELILPNPSEIEITNVNVARNVGSSPPTSKGKKSPIKQEQSISYTPIEKDEHGLFTCNHCSRKFTNVPALHSHKTKVHEEDYLCNFCNIPFKTLQNLRKHNQQCQKARGSPGLTPTQNVLNKRPHLPTKAKNHLKRWLFNHTDHPYPTDVEKQQLMKETNLSLLQVENWFINARRRILADLTRLKNMRGGLFRGRRAGRGRGGRARIDINALDDDMFEPIFEDDHEEAMAASRLLKDLNESDPSCMNPLDDLAEGEIESFELENNEEPQENDPEDIESIIPQYNIANVEHVEDEDEELVEEADPLGDDNSLSHLTSHVKMEIEIDER